MMRYGFIAGCLCQNGDRFVRGGYHEPPLTLLEVLEGMNRRGVAQEVELHYRADETPADEAAIRAALGSLGVAYVNAWTYGEPAWRFGSLSAQDAQTRRKAVERIKATIDFARRMGARGVSLWLGQDGFDYPFQADYARQWAWLLEGLKEICAYAQGMPVALEPKAREPRCFSLIDTVQTALLARMESGCTNLGVTLDVGHTLAGGQGIGPSLALAMGHEALYNLHFNDNYGAWDDDMIVGAVHFAPLLEALYLLEKYGYDGCLSIDIFPYRENTLDAVAESIACLETYRQIIHRLGLQQLDGMLAAGDMPATLRALRQAAFGR